MPSEQQGLTLREARAVEAIGTLLILHDPQAAAQLVEVRPLTVPVGLSRQRGVAVCWTSTSPERPGDAGGSTIGQMTSIWPLEPDMRPTEVAKALYEYLHGGADGDAKLGVPLRDVPYTFTDAEKLADLPVPTGDIEADEAAGRAAFEVSPELRKFYEEHPASNIRRCEFPELGCWTQKSELERTHGELTLTVRLDPCKTWTARLVRLVPIGELEGAAVKAVFISKVGGAPDRETAERAAIEAAQTAGWIE